MARSRASRCARTALAASLLLATQGAVAAPAAAPLDLARVAAEAPNISLLRGPGLPGSQGDLYLEVFLNGISTRRVLHVAVGADRNLYAWPDNLREAGLQTAGLAPDRYVDLAQIPDLTYAYDVANQRVSFSAAAARLHVATQRLNPLQERRYPASSGEGALLNYDLHGSLAPGGARSLTALTELRAFGDWGVLSNTGLSQQAPGSADRGYLRLDTGWTRSLPEQLVTARAGDLISGSLSWSRPTRLGGLQLRRNFALAPELVTFPLPAFFGQAALPSAVELYVNGVRQYSGSVPPGPFELNAPPGINGAGQARVLITDALGRRSVLDFAYYSADRLLKPGLSDWSAEAGLLRRGYGLQSFAYAEPALSGSLRHGLQDWLTLEAHAEAGDDLALAGIGAVLRPGGGGLLSGALAASGGGGDDGQLLSLGYSWIQGRYHAEIASQRSFGDYADVASRGGRAPPQRSERLLGGVVLGRSGSLSASYTRLETREDGRFRLLGLHYAAALPRRVSFFASASHDLESRDSSAFAGLAWSFRGGPSASLSLQQAGDDSVVGADLSQPLRAEGGLGWSLRSQQGRALEAYQAEFAWRDDWGQLTGGAYRVNDDQSVFATVSGGLVWMDRDLFVTHRADEAFALVSTGGVSDVAVRLENRLVGHTDEEGHYLLTGLNAWQPNRVSIDLLALPAQVLADAVQKEAVPAERAGVRLDFGLRRSRVALVTLVDAAGQALPLGSRVRVAGSAAAPAVVGYDGQVYLEDLPPRIRIAAVTPADTVCETAFELPAAFAGVPLVGPLSCQ